MYCLVKDDSAHWFVIPIELRAKFEEWLRWVELWTPEEVGYEGPNFDQYMLADGAKSIVFPSYEIVR